jgi:hypothetical protein
MLFSFPLDPGPEDGRDPYYSLPYARVQIRYFLVKVASIGRSGHTYLGLFRDDPNETLGSVREKVHGSG